KNVNEEADQYSEYLWKMEKNNEISEEERNSYIGIYRLLHQIEKNENNVIGRVIQTDQELTLRNLLSAVRSNKAKGMDVSVSDEFGALEDLITDNTSISQQIETAFHQKQYYQNLSKDTLEQLTPEKLKQTSIDLNLSLEAFQEQIANAQDTQEFDQSAYQDQMQRFQEASMAEDQVIQSLIDANEPVTIDHILAQAEWMNHANQTFQQIMTYSGQKKEEKTIFYDQIRERMDNLYENSDQEEGLKTSYEQLLDTCKEMLSETSMEKTSSIDVRAINLIHKQLTIAGSLSKEDDYQMPVYIGEELSVIHLKVIKGTKEGKVTASMNSKKYGDVSAEFEVDGKQVTGIIVSNDSEGVVKLSEIEPKLKELLETTGKEMKKLNFVQSNEYGKTQSAKEDIQKQDNNTDTKSLYEVAKAFITVISGKNER
ncbi:MAG: hypothetical protein GX567_08520, partial [Clostridia bacterium]|nr:hypothetical protein [Clostridia bacterium]